MRVWVRVRVLHLCNHTLYAHAFLAPIPLIIILHQKYNTHREPKCTVVHISMQSYARNRVVFMHPKVVKILLNTERVYAYSSMGGKPCIGGKPGAGLGSLGPGPHRKSGAGDPLISKYRHLSDLTVNFSFLKFSCRLAVSWFKVAFSFSLIGICSCIY